MSLNFYEVYRFLSYLKKKSVCIIIRSVALLTKRDGVAATITGHTCSGLTNEGLLNTGSNLYFSFWISLVCTIFIMEGWMQAKALKLTTKNQDVESPSTEEKVLDKPQTNLEK